MKFRIKAKDSRSELIEKVHEFLYSLYSQKEGISDFQLQINAIPDGNKSITFSITFNWKNIIAVSLIWPTDEEEAITIVKTKDGEYEPFEKEELRFFDLLDFEINRKHHVVTNQEITDWTGM